MNRSGHRLVAIAEEINAGSPMQTRCSSINRLATAMLLGISRLPLPQGRRRRPHLASSLDPCATPPPTLPLLFLSAQLKCECRPRRGSRRLLECPLFRVSSAPLPTAAPPDPRLLLPQPGMRIPPRRSGLAGSVRYPMRWRGFLCSDQRPCRDRLGAGPSIPGCKDQERHLLWLPAP